MKTIKQYKIVPDETEIKLIVPEGIEFLSAIPKFDRYIMLYAIADDEKEKTEKIIYCYKMGQTMTDKDSLKHIASVYLHKYIFVFHLFVRENNVG